MRLFLPLLVIIGSAMISPVVSASACEPLLAPVSAEVRAQRVALARWAVDQGVPVFMRRGQRGDLPTLLVQARHSRLFLKDVLSRSMATVVKLDPTLRGGTDHGMIRVGHRLIDFFAQDGKNQGASHPTNIFWNPLSTYLPSRREGSSKFIELLYRTTPEEQDSIEYYHRVRRAAFFQVLSHYRRPDLDGLFERGLPLGFEHCYTYGTGVCHPAHEIALTEKLQALRFSPALLETDAQVRSGVTKLRQKILSLDLDAPASLDPEVEKSLLSPALVVGSSLERMLLDRGYSADHSRLIALFLVGLHASREFASVARTLELDSGRVPAPEERIHFLEPLRSRAIGFLIYDEQADAGDFSRGELEWFGARYHFGGSERLNRPVEHSDVERMVFEKKGRR